MADIVYNEAKKREADGDLDWAADTIKALLTTDAYSPDPDDSFLDEGGASDPVDAEIGATAYTRVTLTGKAVTKSDADDRVYFEADDPDFGSIGNGTNAEMEWLLVYKQVNDDTDSYLISAHQIGGVSTIGAPFQPKWDSKGVWFK